MAAGEYVSVSSQADTEKADLAFEQRSLSENLEFEQMELAEIYKRRGLDAALAEEVATQLMAHDALGAHARDELGISENTRPRPLQAALYSGGTFTIGAALPLMTAWAAPAEKLIGVVAISSLIFLAAMGGLAARIGGAAVWVGAARVTFWGALAMALTAVIGRIFGVVA